MKSNTHPGTVALAAAALLATGIQKTDQGTTPTGQTPTSGHPRTQGGGSMRATGTISRGTLRGDVRGGGALVHVRTGSGGIRIE